MEPTSVEEYSEDYFSELCVKNVQEYAEKFNQSYYWQHECINDQLVKYFDYLDDINTRLKAMDSVQTVIIDEDEAVDDNYKDLVNESNIHFQKLNSFAEATPEEKEATIDYLKQYDEERKGKILISFKTGKSDFQLDRETEILILKTFNFYHSIHSILLDAPEVEDEIPMTIEDKKAVIVKMLSEVIKLSPLESTYY